MKKRDRPQRRQLILDTYAQIGTIRGTVRKLSISIHVVRRVLRGQDIEVAVAGHKRSSKLDPYRAVIERLVLEDKLSAVLVLEEIRRLGYEGGYSTLKTCVRQIRPAPKVRLTTRLEHPPGAEGQVDWSPYRVELGGGERVVHGFSMVLPFSRFMVLRFSLDEQLETLLLLQDEAFRMLRGIPRMMTYDNMTTVGRHVAAGEVWLNPRFEAYRKECGFEVRLIDPGKPNQHATVERAFHYVENNCLRRRRCRFDSLEALNGHAAWWCAEVANVRVHGSTRERPVDRVERERAFLLPLPSLRPETYRSVARTVGSDFCVAIDTNRYSVPPKHVGQAATVHVYGERIEVLVGGEGVAVHVLCDARHQRQVLPEHEQAFCRLTPSRRLLEQAFLRLGPAAQSYYEGLKMQRGRGAGYHLQRILKLADRYGSSRVGGAMAHAARYGNYSAEAVARVLTGRALRRLRKDDGRASAMPAEQVRLWLEGMDVESSDLGDYDRLIDGLEPGGDAPSSDEAAGAGEPDAGAGSAEGGGGDGGGHRGDDGGGDGGGDGDAGGDVEEG